MIYCALHLELLSVNKSYFTNLQLCQIKVLQICHFIQIIFSAGVLLTQKEAAIYCDQRGLESPECQHQLSIRC